MKRRDVPVLRSTGRQAALEVHDHPPIGRHIHVGTVLKRGEAYEENGMFVVKGWNVSGRIGGIEYRLDGES